MDGKINVLVVDDEQSIRKAFIRLLRGKEYSVFEAENGQKALEYFRNQKLDICFVDINMPVMGGIETLKEIKKAHEETRVVMMTGFGDTNQALQAIELGAVDYISKPFNNQDIKRLITENTKRKTKDPIEGATKSSLDVSSKTLTNRLEKSLGHILIIDEDVDMQDFLKKSLINSGYHNVTTVNGVDKAINELKSKQYQVVIIDLSQSGSDGITFINSVKEYDLSPEVIALTDSDKLKTAQEALQLGAYDYLIKPFADTGDIVRIVNRAIEKQNLTQRNRQLTDNLKRRVFELHTLHDISNAISYTFDYNQLVIMTMQSIKNVIDYDIACSYLMDREFDNLTICLSQPVSENLIEDIKKDILSAFFDLTNRESSEDKIIFNLSRLYDKKTQGKIEGITSLKSFFDIPLRVGNEIVGMTRISSCRENAFSRDDAKLLYTIANQMSGPIERLRHIIAQEQSRMESMVESMSEGVIMLNEMGEIVIINPQARRMMDFGLKEEIMTGVLLEKLKQLDLAESVEECRDRQAVIVNEITLPREETVILSCHTVPVFDRKGEIIGVCIILRDITNEKDLDKRKTEFISIVSHELRTPLAITKEGINLLMDKVPGEINNKQDKILSNVKENIVRLERMINDLLDISKIEAGKAHLKKELTSMNDLIGKIVASFEQKVRMKGLELKTRLPKDDIYIFIDEDKIIGVFTNLIGNALKFTQEGCIEISVKEFENVLECTVADTGIGIAQEDLPKVFGKFEQFGRSHNSGIKGTGLGLSIAKSIVEMHSGQITVESEPGKGTKFIFSIPQCDAEAILKEYIKSGIHEASKTDSKLSLMVLSLTDVKELKKKFSAEKIRLILKELETILKNSLRREKDVALEVCGRISVLLSDCDKESALKVKDRLEQDLKEALARAKFANNIHFRWGYAVYPDEAQSDEELIAKAIES
jgi:PAS domain S-box-containing protein